MRRNSSRPAAAREPETAPAGGGRGSPAPPASGPVTGPSPADQASRPSAGSTSRKARRRVRTAPGIAARKPGARLTFSRRIRIRPPQASPARQAVSSATPKLSVRTAASSRASSSRAAAITSPSTQPPETELANSPSARTARCAPTPRGAEPQVAVTVASATGCPAATQARACSSAARSGSPAGGAEEEGGGADAVMAGSAGGSGDCVSSTDRAARG